MLQKTTERLGKEVGRTWNFRTGSKACVWMLSALPTGHVVALSNSSHLYERIDLPHSIFTRIQWAKRYCSRCNSNMNSPHVDKRQRKAAVRHRDDQGTKKQTPGNRLYRHLHPPFSPTQGPWSQTSKTSSASGKPFPPGSRRRSVPPPTPVTLTVLLSSFLKSLSCPQLLF